MPYPSDAPPPAAPGSPGYEAYKAYWEARGQKVDGSGGAPPPAPDPERNNYDPNNIPFSQKFNDAHNQFWGQVNVKGPNGQPMQPGDVLGTVEEKLFGGRKTDPYNRDPNANRSGDEIRNQQLQLMQQLQDQAAGKGPSIAQLQLQKGGDQAMSQAMALGASQRGAGRAGALKGIANQQAKIGQGMANDSAMLRLQEQMQARTQLGTGLASMRSSDEARSQFQQKQDMDRWKAQQELDAQAAQRNSWGGAIGNIFGAVSSIGGSKKE